MVRDTSLDEFLTDDGTDEDDASGNEESDRTDGSDGSDGSEDPTGGDDSDETDDDPTEGRATGGSPAPAPSPARSTFAFDPEGAACDACGETVRRRWRVDGAFVCGACSPWSGG